MLPMPRAVRIGKRGNAGNSCGVGCRKTRQVHRLPLRQYHHQTQPCISFRMSPPGLAMGRLYFFARRLSLLTPAKDLEGHAARPFL
jgi:hypothetical protein